MQNQLSIKATDPIPAEQPTLVIEYTCTVCGAICEGEQSPGFIARYCEDCRNDPERLAALNAARQATFRAKHKTDPKYRKANAERQAAYRKAKAADPEYKAKEAARKRAARAAKKSNTP